MYVSFLDILVLPFLLIIQVPQFLLEDYTDSGRGSYCNIIIAHPHRVVAMASAERISAERNEKLGDSVGYEVSLPFAVVLPWLPLCTQVDVGYCIPTNSGRIMFCTTEVLLAKIRLNPLLMGTCIWHVKIIQLDVQNTSTLIYF